jgi:hypothetical protein
MVRSSPLSTREEKLGECGGQVVAADGNVGFRRRRFEETLVALQVEFRLLGTTKKVAPVPRCTSLVRVADQGAQPWAVFLLLFAEDAPLGE